MNYNEKRILAGLIGIVIFLGGWFLLVLVLSYYVLRGVESLV